MPDLGIYRSNAFRNSSGVQVVANANVEVRRESDGGLATIYSDRAGASPIAQAAYPSTSGFKADANGAFEFYAAGLQDGYKIRVYSDDLTVDATARYQPVGTSRYPDVSAWFAATLMQLTTRLAVRRALKALGQDGGITSRASNTILAAADEGGAFRATASFTQTLTAAATLGADWAVQYRVDRGATITFDPNGSETIDGEITKRVKGPAAGVIVCDGSGFHTFGMDQPPVRGHIVGLGLSNNTTDATNDIDVASGEATADDGSRLVELLSATTKRLDATFVAGSGNGGRSSSVSLSDTTYHVFLGLFAGAADIGFDTSATGANLVADHGATALRRLGSIVRLSAAIKKFWQIEDEFYWDAGAQDFSGTLPTTRGTVTLTVPTGINVQALVFAFINSNATNNVAHWVGDLRITDAGPGTGATMPFEAQHGDPVSGWGLGVSLFRAYTNTSAQVGHRCGVTGSTGGALRTFGWIDRRGRHNYA